MTKDDKSQPATRRDVEEIVGRVVGEIVGDALQMIANRFDQVDARFTAIDKRFDKHDTQFKTIEKRFDQQDEDIVKLHGTTARTERKLDAVIEQVDSHSLNLHRLKRRAV
jgi:archaellum component FlaC